MAADRNRTAKQRRQQILEIHGWAYTLKGQVGDPCTYCGECSDTMDHIPPVHYLARVRDLEAEVENCRMVPACKDCNSTLGGLLILNVADRRKHVKTRIRDRFKKFLRMPEWDEDDLRGMSEALVREIAAYLVVKAQAERRLRWKP